MKKVIMLLYCLYSALNCSCQLNDSAIIATHGWIKTIDGVPVKGDTISIVPGKHVATIENLITIPIGLRSQILQSIKINNLKLDFTLVKNNQYTLIFSPVNYYQSGDRTIYFNYLLPRLFDTKTMLPVSRMENVLEFDPKADSCNIVPLNYDCEGIEKFQPAVFPFIFEFNYNALFLKGWTKDNYIINYTINRDSIYEITKKTLHSKGCENLKIYLKPGYYWIGYNYISTEIGYPNNQNVQASNSFIFKAESGDTIHIDQSYYLPDRSATGSKVMRQSNLNSIFFLPGGKNGWIVGDSKTILYTSDGGKTWRYSKEGKSYDGFRLYESISHGWYTDICFIDSLNGWIVGESGTILHTVDGGAKWTYQNVKSGVFENLGNVRFFNRSVGFVSQEAASRGAKLYSTTNGGVSWKLLGKEYGDAKYYCFGYNNIWKVKDSVISHSTDMGNTWSFSLDYKKPSTENYSLTRLENLVYFIDPLHGWILQDGILATTDGGKTWKEQTMRILPDMVYFINKDIGWAFSEYGLVCRTTDGGNNWSRVITDTIITNVRKVYFTDENEGWIVGEHGFIYHTFDGGQNWKVMNVLDFI
jgi:photosystem II stability/assembly factor-like uncharacterized protein